MLTIIFKYGSFKYSWIIILPQPTITLSVIQVFWAVTLSRLVNSYRRFGVRQYKINHTNLLDRQYQGNAKYSLGCTPLHPG
jgi:hypothetical protein